MLAEASCHTIGLSINRNNPLMRFPCCEIVASASNLLITVAGSISTSSLSVDRKHRKSVSLPPRQGRFRGNYFPLIPLSVLSSPHRAGRLRNPLQPHLD